MEKIDRPRTNTTASLRLAVLIAVIFLIHPTPAAAQLSVKNQFNFTDWQDYDRTILENWTDAVYQRGGLQIGGRYEINYPPDPFIFPQDSLLRQFDFTFAYAQYEMKNWQLRAGNFYSMFGRGLLLRTYEDRNLRVDNNILGGAVAYDADRLSVKAVAGKMRDKYNRRRDFVYGLDAQALVASSLQLGGSHIVRQGPGESAQQMSALRLDYFRDWGQIYAEAVKPGERTAWSQYIGVSGFVGDFVITTEYKNYNGMSFKDGNGAEYNAAPSLTREHSFTLLNRHPHALNMDDEKGWQLEATWTPSPTWDVAANGSKTLTRGGGRIFEEYYLQSHNYLFNETVESYLAAAWNFDYSTNTENITTIVDPQISLAARDLLHLSWQHQHTKNVFDKSEYDSELFQIEYSRSPFGSFALVGEVTNKYLLNNVNMDRHTWLYGQLTLNFWRNQEVQFMYGSRQAGFVCVGGICRYEPEFQGFELALVNRF